MSEIYQDLIFSDFPNKVSEMPRVQDVTISAKPYVDLYNTYYNKGDFDSANQVLQDNPELLRMIVNAETFNILRDEIIATQRTFKDDTEAFIFNVVKIKGDWSSTVKYIKYNVVYYAADGNKLPYMAIADDIPIGASPTNITYWYPLAVVGKQGESGLGLTPRGIWSEYTQYYKDDLVSYNNALWSCNQDNIGYFPNASSTIWYPVLSMNIVWNSIKVTNEEIDAIFAGDADLTDDEVTTDGSDESISKEEIDHVISQ